MSVTVDVVVDVVVVAAVFREEQWKSIKTNWFKSQIQTVAVAAAAAEKGGFVFFFTTI